MDRAIGASRQAGTELERELSPKVCYEMKQMSQIGHGFGNHTTIDSRCVWPRIWSGEWPGSGGKRAPTGTRLQLLFVPVVRAVRVVPIASDSANNRSSVCINCCMGVKGGARTCMYHHPESGPR